MTNSRKHGLTVTCGLEQGKDGASRLLSPQPGLFRHAARAGARIGPGDIVGELEVLGRIYTVLAPAKTQGTVLESERDRPARRPVDFGQTLLDLGRATVAGEAAQAEEAGEATADLVFRSPSAGRYYARPAPGEPPFVEAGGVVEEGQTVALLEVMKTFNRITYRAEGGLPARAKVVRVVPDNESDIGSGDVILELEAD